MNGWCANPLTGPRPGSGAVRKNWGNLEIEKLRFGSTGAEGDHWFLGALNEDRDGRGRDG
jgi:hypothetical protein